MSPEQDVLMVTLPKVLGLFTLFFGLLLGLAVWAVKFFVGRGVEAIDARFRRFDEELKRIDGELRRLAVELPIQYQRRDEAIREYTALNAHLGRLYALLVDMRRSGGAALRRASDDLPENDLHA